MHSKIFEVSMDRDNVGTYSAYEVPYYFTSAIADYVEDESDDKRLDCIEWLAHYLSAKMELCVGRLAINITQDVKDRFFKGQYEEFMDALDKIKDVATLHNFVEDKEISYPLFVMRTCYDDDHSFYMVVDGSLMTLHEFMRFCKCGTYYIGNVIDYHF